MKLQCHDFFLNLIINQCTKKNQSLNVINKVIYQLLSMLWFVFKKYARIKRRSNFFFAVPMTLAK